MSFKSFTIRFLLARYHKAMTNDSGINGVSQGQRFGLLKVIDPARHIVHPGGSSRRAALCRCDCGNDKLVSLNHLISGRVTSCGCQAANRPRIHVEPGTRAGCFTVLGELRDNAGNRRVLLRCTCGSTTTRSLYSLPKLARITHCGGPGHHLAAPAEPPEPQRHKLVVMPGDRFGLRVVLDTGLRHRGTRAARVRCSCGSEQIVSLSHLVRSRSCGHVRPGNHRHGMGHHPLFHVHKAMMARCYKPGSKDYKNYGARGIEVYRPWHDVRNFVADIEAEIGPRPEGTYDSGWSRYTLDRIDNDGDYRPGNMRWATRLQQVHNRRPLPPRPGQ